MKITCHKRMDPSVASFSIYQSWSNVWRMALAQMDMFVLALAIALCALGFIFHFSNPTMEFLNATEPEEPITKASLFKADVNQLEIEKEVNFIVLLYLNVNRLHRCALSHTKEENHPSACHSITLCAAQSNPIVIFHFIWTHEAEAITAVHRNVNTDSKKHKTNQQSRMLEWNGKRDIDVTLFACYLHTFALRVCHLRVSVCHSIGLFVSFNSASKPPDALHQVDCNVYLSLSPECLPVNYKYHERRRETNPISSYGFFLHPNVLSIRCTDELHFLFYFSSHYCLLSSITGIIVGFVTANASPFELVWIVPFAKR